MCGPIHTDWMSAGLSPQSDIQVSLNFACSRVFSERPFEMFLQYSRNGIVIGSIDDVMSGFHSLIGSINQNELPTPPSTGEQQN